MQFLKQSTAFTFLIGPFLSPTDGVTANTSITLAQANIQLSKNGANFAQTSASPSAPHVARGWYQCPLTATDTNTLGQLVVEIGLANTVALPVWKEFTVVPANVYESLIAGNQWLEVTGVRPTMNISGATLTLKAQDGNTTQFTKAVATTANAAPITGLS